MNSCVQYEVSMWWRPILQCYILYIWYAQIYILLAYDMSNSSTTVAITNWYILVRLDENGEPLSKNALKKLLKKEAADKKKAEKAAARVSS